MKKGFTLAEIMIVLTVIGVLTAILLPSAINSTPDENVMKFKKGNATLGTVIRELVNSDKYYLNGDLGIRADGTLIDGTHEGDVTYFCETFSDVVSTKKVNCDNGFHTLPYVDTSYYDGVVSNVKSALDTACKVLFDLNLIEPEITTSDNITYTQTAAKDTFGISMKDSHDLQGYDGDCVGCDIVRNFQYTGIDANGNPGVFYAIYKIFCMDVDGINKGEDPFGYGIRVDGKILPGARADEWINKSIQNKE